MCCMPIIILTRPLTATLLWCLFSSVPHISDSLELHNNWASWILHPGPSEGDVYSDIIQEAQSNDLLHTVRLLMRLGTPLHGNNARGGKYAVHYASVATHTVFENINWLRLELCLIRNVAVPSLACLFPVLTQLESCLFVCLSNSTLLLNIKSQSKQPTEETHQSLIWAKQKECSVWPLTLQEGGTYGTLSNKCINIYKLAHSNNRLLTNPLKDHRYIQFYKLSFESLYM